MAFQSNGHHLNIPSDANGRFRQGVSACLPMLNFLPDVATEFGIDRLLLFSMANPAKIKIRAVANVELVFLGPADKAVITICDLHGGTKSLLSTFCNRLSDLLLLVSMGIITFIAAQSHHA